MSITLTELKTSLDNQLQPWLWNDYGPNGLQIEGQKNISKIAFSVSATKESIKKSADWGAQALIVHHGLFWKFHGPKTITGAFAQRVKPLIKNEINLLGYHLPLDAHLDFGNAAQIAKLLGMTDIKSFGDHKGSPTGVKGNIQKVKSKKLKEKLEQILSHQVLHANPETDPDISTIGIITGGANSDWQLAHKERLDAYITGEMSEHDWHESQESGIHMFAGGHNATEQFGIQALKEYIQKQFPNIETTFFSSENPA